HIAFTTTWLIERAAINKYVSDKRTRKLVTVKDVLIAGAVVTGVANTIVGAMMKRDFPEGAPLPAEGETTPEKAEKIARYALYYKVMGSVPIARLAGSIAMPPVIAASIIRSSRRGLIARLLAK